MPRFANWIKRYYSCRWRLCYACTIALILMQTLRVDISMALVCLLKTPNRTTEEVNNTTSNQHCSGSENYSMNQTFEGELHWSDTLQSNILAGFFYGYTATNFLGGLLADKYGGKRVLGGSILSASILTLLYPSLSRISGYFTLVLRILTGVASGPLFPAIQSLFGHWCPSSEISVFVGFTFAGQFLGNIVGLSISGYLCVYGFDNGWGSIFYVFGGISLLFCCVWFYVVYDNPDVHPTISEEERSYINRTTISEKVVKNVPWKRLLSSPAVWAIIFSLQAYGWMETFVQVLLPLYLKEALSINVISNGLMSSAPSAGLMIGFPLCGKFADFVRSKKCLSTRSVRVLFQTISMVASASLLIAIGLLKCNQTILIIFLLFLSGMTLSFVSGGVLVNTSDIAPSYVGIIFGIANTLASIAGGTASLTIDALTPNGTLEEWQIVFALCAAICVSGAIIFAILARGEIQIWAKPQEPGSCRNAGDVNINKIVH